MRKELRYKAIPMLAAWIIIFAHNVIPHNHPDDCITGCHELVHNTNPSENDCSGPMKYKSQPEDVKVCHISGFLYHEFSPDNYFIEKNKSFSFNPSFAAEHILTSYRQEFVSDYHDKSSLLRAPPAA